MMDRDRIRIRNVMMVSAAKNVEQGISKETEGPYEISADERGTRGLYAVSRIAPGARKCSILLLLGIIGCLSFVPVSRVEAHRVNVFAYVEGTRVCIEGYFGGNSKAKHCVVQVLNSKGAVLTQGRTDDKGLYSFALSKIPKAPGDLTIVLHASSGHKATYTLAANELPTVSAGPAAPASGPSAAAPVEKSSGVTKSQSVSAVERARASRGANDEASMRKVVEEVVDAKIQPLIKMLGNQQRMLLEEQRRGPTIQEIIGGIGWILGIVGVAAYVMSRNRGGRG
jgi:nickel transport protein